MEKINSFIDKKNPEAKAILKVFVCDPIKEDIEKVVEDMWILYNEFLMGGDKRREIQEYLGKILSLVPTIDVDDESIAEVTPVKRPIEKSSNDCYRLQLCPFGKETDKLDHDCEDLCENCKFCPITCGHCPDGLYLMTCGDSGEYDSGCSYFEPNRSYQDKLLFEDISIALNFSHCPPSPPVGIIEDIIAMINDRGPVRCMTTEEKCMVYIKQKTGGIKLIQIPSDRTTIYEDSESPYLSEFALWSVYPEAENETAENNWKHSPNWEYPIYELHVPSGTVIQEYNLNGM